MKNDPDIRNRIQESYKSLSRNKRQIAEFILDNFDRIPFLNVQKISNETSMSVASIVRFAQELGFEGFSEMKYEIINLIQNKLDNKEFFPLLEKHKIREDTLSLVAEQDIKNINSTLNQVDRKTFKKAIELIIGSERIFTMGLGISHFLAQVLSYQLSLIGLEARQFDHVYLSFLEQVVLLNRNDTILGFSFPPYSEETIEAAEQANKKNINVISITNKNSAPITFHSAVSLIVHSENMINTNSFTAISMMLNAIVAECVIRKRVKPEASAEINRESVNEVIKPNSKKAGIKSKSGLIKKTFSYGNIKT
jgi:DNA-binding MurR/RpiR family transcriptional regulator